MDTQRPPKHGPESVDSLARRLSRDVRSSPTLWLATGGAIALLASCSTGSAGSLTNQSAAPSSDGGGSVASPPPSSSDAGASSPAGDGGTDPDAATPPGFDYAVFASTIQPILDTAGTTGCTNTACHGSATGQGGLILARLPAAGSAQMKANYQAVTALCNPAIPDQSLFYIQATNSHGGIAVSQTQASTILAWIQHAAGSPVATATDAGAGCVPATAFNLGVFASEIQPILFGTLDYNEAPGQAVANDGCARSACHGSTTNALSISTTNTPIQNLTNLGCFVNLKNPSASAILQCPLNYPGCPKSPHPGQDVFASQQDLNYQRIASWLYSAQGSANPLDFAFFARQVAPIFSDPASGGIVNGQRTCADTTSCHGVSAVGQIPPNLSNFPILASATTSQGFWANYWSAAAFTNFVNQESGGTGSELFLYPTNTIAGTTAGTYETGFAHPGGVDFSPTSTQAQAILTWAGGLQVDTNGNLLDWLVAGTYDATLVTDSTGVGNDATIAPAIFDADFAQFNGSIWDEFSAPSGGNDFVNLSTALNIATVGSGQIAYAVANVINTFGSDLSDVVFTVTSPNAVELFVGTNSNVGQAAGNNTVSVTLPTLAAYAPGAGASTRILVKVLNRSGDAQFGFTLNVTQNDGQAIPGGELIFRLDPNGGI
ncbi:MAG: hypothetical protein ACLQVI_07765 [Polyangiaceae bacterium]